MSVTLKAIAQHTGLSVPTVGNVLGRAANRYSAETRRRVQAAVEELGYKPNSSARAIRRGRIGSAALVLSRGNASVVSAIPVGLIDGLDDELMVHDMHLTVSRLTDEQLSNDEFLPKVLREYMADGMILNYTQQIPPRMLELIEGHHTPAVWLNAKLAADCVYPDDRFAAEAVTRRLIDAGHRRIALVHLVSPSIHPGRTFEQARPLFHYSVADRHAGFEHAMRASGLTPVARYDDRFVAEADSVAECHALLARPDRPTAILLYSEREAVPLLLAARSLGLSVPRDLTVFVFYPTAQQIADVRLAPVPIPTAEIGRCAVRMLIEKLRDPAVPVAPRAVRYAPADDEVIAPPPAAAT